MKNFIFFRNDRIGDFIILTSIIKGIKDKHKKSHVTVLCSPKNYKFIKNYSIIDKLIVYDKQFNFYKKVKVDNRYIHIIGNFDTNILPHKFPEDNPFSECVSFLKSHLQKCVRRKYISKSIRTAYHLMSINFTEFIRRLSIIMLEDTCLHESITTIVWMMVAYPIWKPNLYQVQWLLGIVHYIASIPIYDKISGIVHEIVDKSKSEISNNKLNKTFDLNKLYFRRK